MFMPIVENMLEELRKSPLSSIEKLEMLFKAFPDLCDKPAKSLSPESVQNFLEHFRIGFDGSEKNLRSKTKLNRKVEPQPKSILNFLRKEKSP